MTKEHVYRLALERIASGGDKSKDEFLSSGDMMEIAVAALASPEEPIAGVARLTRLAILYEKMLDASGIPIPDEIARVSHQPSGPMWIQCKHHKTGRSMPCEECAAEKTAMNWRGG